MTITNCDDRLLHVPLFDAYAAQISDEMPEPPWSDPIRWSAAMRQTADLVSPDLITVSSRDVLVRDVESAATGPIADVEFADAIDEPTEAFVEAIGVTADVRDEPLLALVPDPVSLCLDCFADEWLDLLNEDKFAAMDTLHQLSQLLTELIRALGGTIEGIVLDYRGLETANSNGLRFDDALLEAGAVFNVADHHELSVVGRLPQNLRESAGQFAEKVDALVFDTVSSDEIDSLGAISVQTGGGFPEQFWELGEPAFDVQLTAYTDLVPESFILMTTIPATVDPERVQLYREVVTTE